MQARPFLVVATAPEEQGETTPLNNRDGLYLRSQLSETELDFDELSLSYAIACAPVVSPEWSDSKMKKLVRASKKAQNDEAKRRLERELEAWRARKAEAEAKWKAEPKKAKGSKPDIPLKPTLRTMMEKVEDQVPLVLMPQVACRPRLLLEAQSAKTILTLGPESFKSITGRKNVKIMKVYGTFVSHAQWKVAPAISLRGLRGRMRLARSFGVVIQKAVKWHQDELEVPETTIHWLPPPPLYLIENGKKQRIPDKESFQLPSLRNIRKLLRELRKEPYVAYDLETTDINALTARIRTVQLATETDAWVIYIRSKEEEETSQARHFPYFYDRATTREIFRELQAYFADKNGTRHVGLNNVGYDNLVLIREGYRFLGEPILVHRPIDVMIIHRVADPDVPHSLSFQGIMYATVSDWKASYGDEDAYDPDTDYELGKYGGTDGTTTAQVFEPVHHDLTAPDGGGPQGPKVYAHDLKLAHVCQGMRTIGYQVDQVERNRLETMLYQLADHARAECARALGNLGHWAVEGNDLNGWRFKVDGKGKPLLSLTSPPQQAELFYGQGEGCWHLPPPKDLVSPFDPEETDYVDWIKSGMKAKFYSKEGNPTTGDPVLRAYLAEKEINEWQTLYMSELRRCRKALKLIQDKLTPLKQLDPDDYDAEGYCKVRKSGKKYPVSAVWADGIFRTGWKLGPPIGRLASGDPVNAQNFSKLVRGVLVAPDGHVLVGADFDQLHLKIIANIWRIPSLIEDFRLNRDPHQTMAEISFGDAYRNAEGYPKKGKAGRMRNWGKTIRFTGAYGGSARAIFSVMQKADTGADLDGADLEVLLRAAWRLTNLDVQLDQVGKFYENWMDREPEWRQSWRAALRNYEAKGYVEDDILGRRAYLRDGTQLFTKVPNVRVLMNEGALAGAATYEIAEAIPFKSWSPYTGIVEQCHDAIVVCVPKERAEEARAIVQRAMNRQVDGHPVPYTATADIGHRRTQVA